MTNMDDNLRKRSFDYVIADIRKLLTEMRKSANERCENAQNPGAVYRLTAIENILNYLETISSSPHPWTYFVSEATYDTRRITKTTIWLLKKHKIIEGVDSIQDILVLNALSKSWGLVDLVAAQLKNRLTRKKCIQLLESKAEKRWERAAETYISNHTNRGKIRRCLIYLYINKLLPGHDRREVQVFFRILEKYENINWTEAPDCVLQTKHRLEQISGSIRQRRKKEREEIPQHD